MNDDISSRHVLLTALGMINKPTPYQRQGHDQIVEASLAPLALLQLLPEEAKPTRVLALCTVAAKEKTWPVFAEGVQSHLGIDAEPLDIPNGQTEAEVRQIIETAAAQFAEGDELTLDVTQGFRHFPFITYALALYLLSLRSIRLRGAYYGMVEGIPRYCQSSWMENFRRRGISSLHPRR